MSPWRRIRRRLKSLAMRHAPGMITCCEFEAFILDYHEDNLPPRQRRVFERHMAMCPPCRVSFEHYRKAIALGRGVCAEAEREAPAPVPEDLVAAILAARRSS